MNNNDYTSKINNIMDKAKEDVRTQIDRAYQQGYEDAKSELGQNAIDLAHEESDRAYQQGLEDAWKAQRKIIYDEGLSMRELMQIFGTESYEKILKENTASEAIAKIKEYEKQQKQDTIQVGDEVITKFGTKGIVITDVPSGDGKISVWLQNFTHVQLYPVKDLSKTGRHFDAIAEVLEERNKYV